MAPSKVRKVMGAVKDQTSIGLAKVASTRAPDLDVAIVKATSHDEIPPEEKHIQEILYLTSISRGYVNACVSGIAKRLGKTHNWIVALKSIGLIHRLLRDGDPSFEYEVNYATRRGARLLNLSDFRDDSYSNAWDYSSFVRAYALYLDERLDCALSQRKNANSSVNGRNRLMLTYNGFGYSEPENGYSNGYGDYRQRYDGFQEEPAQEENDEPKAIREMDTKTVFEKTHRWQRVLERFLACRPQGASKVHRLVHFSLYLLVKESFKLYADICEALAVILDRYFDMECSDCAKAFETYARAAKQIEESKEFLDWCKNMGICRSSEYPEIHYISNKLLEKLEEYLQEKSSFTEQRPVIPPRVPESPPKEEYVEDMNSIKALPAPEDDGKKEPVKEQVEPVIQKKEPECDLLDLTDITAEEQEKQLTLALFSDSNGNQKWEAFNSTNESSSAWETPLAEEGKAGWELALVESASNLSKQGNSMPGGFNKLLLEGLYDQAASRQQYLAQTMTPGSASSVALPQKQSTVLALPGPEGQAVNNDPFAASLSVPAPSYVQMADMAKKQQYLDGERLMWEQYKKEGQLGVMKLYSNPYGMPPQNSFGMPSYGMPPYGMLSYGMPQYGLH
eukprot:TRINITY_DN1986_c0_g1_i1.p1 TRINITY_DN1986_c0_g1~~TRINITY_DN1986_c0_g1_i1.p1  ORF type:complete len:621 (-),score=124.48 TRINITY_DN1986_c0_g1_i1:317-2179(-)